MDISKNFRIWKDVEANCVCSEFKYDKFEDMSAYEICICDVNKAI